jgi:H+/Cl- antiporter ClcA
LYQRKRSSLWYLLPIFLGVIGGIIGYFAVRHDDPLMAKRIFILGVIIFAIGLLISLMTPVDISIPSTNTNN